MRGVSNKPGISIVICGARFAGDHEPGRQAPGGELEHREYLADPQRDSRLELLERLLGEGVCRRLGIYALPADFLLSVVIPVYNEVDTVAEVVRRVRAQAHERPAGTPERGR